MPFFPDTETFYKVMADLFGRALAQPSVQQMVQNGNLVARVISTAPDAILTVDGKSKPPVLVTGPSDLAPDVTLRAPADLLHKFWLGQASVQGAFFSGQIKVEGNLMRAMGMADLFSASEALYPEVLRAHGLM